MTLQAVQGGIFFPSVIIGNPRITWVGTAGGLTQTSTSPIDAATEKIAFMGHARWEGSPAGAKTFGTSSKIHFKTGTVTFADAGTTVRVGIQGVSGDGSGVSGMTPDGAFDVYVDLAGNGGVITSSDDNVYKSVTMSTGSKSITDGDLIAIVFDMTARGGSDSLILAGPTSDGYFTNPGYRLYNGGAWQNFSGAVMPNILLEADDGTFGILRGAMFIIGPSSQNFSATYSYTSSSSPDEYGLIFQVPFCCKVDALWFSLATSAANADATIALYSDPLGTPTVMASASHYGEYGNNGTDNRPRLVPITEQTLAPGTDYCVALVAAGAGSCVLGYTTLASANHRTVQGLANCRRGSRTNATGAFSEMTTEIPLMGVQISALDDGATAGRLVRTASGGRW